jgi:hypothetical protein
VTYWLFYAFNDAPTGITGAFDHEGDWERVSVRLDSQTAPPTSRSSPTTATAPCPGTRCAPSGATRSSTAPTAPTPRTRPRASTASTRPPKGPAGGPGGGSSTSAPGPGTASVAPGGGGCDRRHHRPPRPLPVQAGRAVRLDRALLTATGGVVHPPAPAGRQGVGHQG